MQIRLIVACSNSSGVPCLVPIEVTTTAAAYTRGVHYELAEYELGLKGYEKPFVCIDEHDSPEMVKLVSDRPDKELHKGLIALLVEFGEWLDADDARCGACGPARKANEAFQAAEHAASEYQQSYKREEEK